MMDSVTLTIHFKNRVRLFYPKHLPGPQLTMAIQKTFDLGSDDEVELVDRISNERLSLTKLHSLPPNSHIVSTLVLKHNLETTKNMFNKRNTLLSQEKTVVVHKENGTLGFKVQYFFAPSQTNLASPYHRMATIFVKQLDANGPAAKAGLKQGDRILKVNGVSVFTKSLEDVVLMMKKREDYVVLTTVPWYKDFLQVEYPNYAYSEPESDTSTTSLDRFSPLRTPPTAVSDRRFNSLTRNHTPEARPGFSTQPRRSGTRSPKCTRPPDDVPVKPPRPSYVLRRQDRDPAKQRPKRETSIGGSLEGVAMASPRSLPKQPALRSANHRLSYSLDDKRKRFGNLQYFEDFQLPEKPPSAEADSKEMDPLCEALISQSKITPNELHRLTSDCNMEGYLDCKIVDENSKRHTLRGWTKYFTTLHASQLSLYKNYNDYVEKRDAPEEGPEDISNCLVSIEYRLKKPVFRLTCQNGKEYLLKADSNEEMLEWIGVIQKLNDNQSLCNNLIKRKADELLKSDNNTELDTKNKKSSTKVKEYKQVDFHVNSQYDFPSFGSTIDKCVKCTRNKLVPAVVSDCIREVEERGLAITGIYRLSGNEKAIHSLINEIDKDPRSVDYKSPPWTDIHNTCAALKQYFRRLAEPLVPSPLYPAFMEAAQIQEQEARQAKLKTLVHMLPECHLATAKLLFGHLATVAANAEGNKMHTYNLAIIFGPTVIRSANNDMVSLVADMSNQYKVVECLITKYSYIFEDELPVEETETQSEEKQSEEKESEEKESEEKESEKSEKSADSEMGIFGQKKHLPSQNGLTTPTDDRASLPTGWEYDHVINRERQSQVDKSDKSTQCSIPKSPTPHSAEDKIYYRKEPVGIVHPYKDDIKMRPISRIIDKKLVTIDTSAREDKRRDVAVVDMKEPKTRKVSYYHPVAPKKSLSLESLLDVINAEQQQKRHLAKRGYSQQFESIHKFVNGLHQRNGMKGYKPSSAPQTRGISTATSPCIASPAICTAGPVKPSHSIPVKPIKPVNYSHPIYAVPYRKSSFSDERSERSRAPSDQASSEPRSQHDMVRTNTRKSVESSRSRSSEPRWVENMLHSHQGSHPAIPTADQEQVYVSRSHDHLSNTRSSSDHHHYQRQKPRRHSDARGWQPGQTHKWVLDNNTTLLESTL